MNFKRTSVNYSDSNVTQGDLVTIMDHVRPSKGNYESQTPILQSSTLKQSNPRPQGFYLGSKSKPLQIEAKNNLPKHV